MNKIIPFGEIKKYGRRIQHNESINNKNIGFFNIKLFSRIKHKLSYP